MHHRFRARLGTLVVKIGPDTRERFGIALLDEGDHLLPDLAALASATDPSGGRDPPL